MGWGGIIGISRATGRRCHGRCMVGRSRLFQVQLLLLIGNRRRRWFSGGSGMLKATAHVECQRNVTLGRQDIAQASGVRGGRGRATELEAARGSRGGGLAAEDDAAGGCGGGAPLAGTAYGARRRENLQGN